MTEPRQLATVRCWKDIPAAIRAAIDERKTTCASVDEICGLADGHTAKITAPVPTRGLGETSFDALMEGLGFMFVMVEDPERTAQYQARLDSREEWRVTNARMHSEAVHVRLSRRKMSRNGRKGGRNSRKYMSPKKAGRLAKMAAKRRWRRVRAAKAAARRRARLALLAARVAQAATASPCAS